MTSHKSEAYRKEIEMIMEDDMIEPSNSPSACGVIISKKNSGQIRFCRDFRYLNEVMVKHAYPTPPPPPASMNVFQSWETKTFSRRWIWALHFGKCPPGKRIHRKRALHENWDCSSEKEYSLCRLDYAT